MKSRRSIATIAVNKDIWQHSAGSQEEEHIKETVVKEIRKEEKEKEMAKANDRYSVTIAESTDISREIVRSRDGMDRDNSTV